MRFRAPQAKNIRIKSTHLYRSSISPVDARKLSVVYQVGTRIFEVSIFSSLRLYFGLSFADIFFEKFFYLPSIEAFQEVF